MVLTCFQYFTFSLTLLSNCPPLSLCSLLPLPSSPLMSRRPIPPPVPSMSRSINAAPTSSSPPRPLDYDSLFRLFTHRHTAWAPELLGRQAAALRQIARAKKNGLHMADIDPVCRIMKLAINKLPE